MTELTGKLFVLEASGDGRLFSINPDGSDKTDLVTGCRIPDGVAIDVEAGHIYWTNMGMPPANDGSIERADLDGGNRTTIVPSGGTYTPKQLHFDPSIASCTGATAKECVSCGATSMGPTSRPWCKPGRVKTTAATRRTGASESPSTMSVGISTGPRRVPATPGWAGYCGL